MAAMWYNEADLIGASSDAPYDAAQPCDFSLLFPASFDDAMTFPSSMESTPDLSARLSALSVRDGRAHRRAATSPIASPARSARSASNASDFAPQIRLDAPTASSAKGKRAAAVTKQPRNAFILYRQALPALYPHIAALEPHQGQRSRLAGAMWREESPEVVARFFAAQETEARAWRAARGLGPEDEPSERDAQKAVRKRERIRARRATARGDVSGLSERSEIILRLWAAGGDAQAIVDAVTAHESAARRAMNGLAPPMQQSPAAIKTAALARLLQLDTGVGAAPAVAVTPATPALCFESLFQQQARHLSSPLSPAYSPYSSARSSPSPRSSPAMSELSLAPSTAPSSPASSRTPLGESHKHNAELTLPDAPVDFDFDSELERGETPFDDATPLALDDMPFFLAAADNHGELPLFFSEPMEYTFSEAPFEFSSPHSFDAGSPVFPGDAGSFEAPVHTLGDAADLAALSASYAPLYASPTILESFFPHDYDCSF